MLCMRTDGLIFSLSGIDRILGRRCHNQSQVKSPLSAHIDPSALHVPEGKRARVRHQNMRV